MIIILMENTNDYNKTPTNDDHDDDEYWMGILGGQIDHAKYVNFMKAKNVGRAPRLNSSIITFCNIRASGPPPLHPLSPMFTLLLAVNYSDNNN